MAGDVWSGRIVGAGAWARKRRPGHILASPILRVPSDNRGQKKEGRSFLRFAESGACLADMKRVANEQAISPANPDGLRSGISWDKVNWTNSSFLIATAALTVTAVPWYLWRFGADWFQAILFVVFFALTGLSITLGYHRLFAHAAFQAAWPVRLGALVFGAAAFQNTLLCWAADHRQHHKFVDQENDPYDISKGFWHAHMGWILFRLAPDADLALVKDLQQDRLVCWQHRNYVLLAVAASFLLPAAIGWAWGGWCAALGAFLLAGVARLVAVQQFTFFINSLCHTIGRRPYSSHCTARDSGLMAFFTFGEGYHNFHHSFQHDYRNGVKYWQFDPTKWSIWLLHMLGLASHLRRVPEERILLAELHERQRLFTEKLQRRSLPALEFFQSRWLALQEAFHYWEQREREYQHTLETHWAASREKLTEVKREFRVARERFHAAIHDWQVACRLLEAQMA